MSKDERRYVMKTNGYGWMCSARKIRIHFTGFEISCRCADATAYSARSTKALCAVPLCVYDCIKHPRRFSSHLLVTLQLVVNRKFTSFRLSSLSAIIKHCNEPGKCFAATTATQRLN